MSFPIISRVPKQFRKTVTFDGSSGGGAVGTVAVGTVTGMVAITLGGIRCTTNLASSGGGSVSLGVSGNADGLIEATLATDIDSGDIWQDASPEVGISPAIVNQLVSGNLILTVTDADITAGVLEIDLLWTPMSADGNLA